jgi:MoxR-like ATPase
LDTLILGLICNGHVLLEGVPGVAKTLIIRALGQITGCSVKRVQFTVDLLPSDIIGLTTYTPGKGFEIVKGPIFTNFLIADEINRASPKTQSALLEAMQERQVTIGKTSFETPTPFFVMATKNPLESNGIYQLPEAQVDRFLFNVIIGYPNPEEEKKIMEENATLKKFDEFNLMPVINSNDILYMQNLVKKIHLGNHVKNYILAIVEKTRDKSFKFADCISYGSSPRASIALFIASKAKALLEGRSYVIPEDVRAICFDVLRHRILLSYKATIKGLTSEDIIKEILEEIRV